MMLKRSLLIIFACILSKVGYSQAQLTIPKYLKLPADSSLLINAVNGFLSSMVKPNKDNEFIEQATLVETGCLADEMRNMENAGANKKGFYKCYLANVSSLDSVSFVIQLQYLADNNGAPILRASFKLIAKKQGNGYVLSSPLKLNTVGWQVKKMGSFNIYSNAPVYNDKLYGYVKKAIEYDKRLHAPDYPSQIYCCENFVQALALLGVEYKLDYNGINHDNLSTWEGGRSLYIIGASQNDLTAFDHHDLWHSRLHHVISIDVINRPLDEACAYLYGGSWGIYSWPDITHLFKTYMVADNDWLKAFNEHRKFGGTQTPLYTDYVIDALIIKQLDKQKGFAAVIELLSCGKKQPNNENFFAALEKLTGINKANFNQRVGELMRTL